MTPSRVHAVIFDMDGVLIDSEPLHLESTNAVLHPHGAHLSPEANDAYIGWNERAYWTELVRIFELPGTIDDYIAERQTIVTELLKRQLPIADGVTEVVRALFARGLPLAVASSSQRGVIEHVLREGGFAPYFRAIASGDEVKRSKPDPEIFLLAATRLGVDPARCLVFEDAPHGARGALAAGMVCVRVMTTTTRNMTFPETSAVIETFRGLDVDRILGLERTKK